MTLIKYPIQYKQLYQEYVMYMLEMYFLQVLGMLNKNNSSSHPHGKKAKKNAQKYTVGKVSVLINNYRYLLISMFLIFFENAT